MASLNYHHLRYFHAIAKEGSLTKAAQHLHISQSALSVQLKKLEEDLGQPLFDREHKSLVLTEAGRIAMGHAESIFRTGEELLDTLQHRSPNKRTVLRIGGVSTLSRNFQLTLLRPLIGRENLELVLHSGSLRVLLGQLKAHTIDLILSNQAVRRDADSAWFSHLLDEQPVSLVAKKKVRQKKFRFPEDLENTPIILPGMESSIRTAFDLMMENAGIRPNIAAEVDDMAMLRLLARESGTLTLVPPVVVRDELANRTLIERHRFPEIKETFYAITPTRRFPNNIVKELIRGWKE